MLSNRTKIMRSNFRRMYSSQSAKIIQRIAKGETSQQIADRLGVSRPTVTTTRGNLNRGLYYPFAYTSHDNYTVIGQCEF